MMFRTAIALLALVTPVIAQHGGHGGSFGGRGSGGHAGFSGSPGFTRSFASPAPPVHYGSPSFGYNLPAARYGPMNGARGRAGLRSAIPPRYSGFRNPYSTSSHIPYNGNRFGPGRAPYQHSGADSRAGDGSRGGDHDRRGGDHERFDRRRRDFNNWYSYGYPYWLGYPYLVGPGFYDWGDTDSGDTEQPSAYDQGGYGYDQSGTAPAYPPAYPEEGYRTPYQPPAGQSADPAPAAASVPLSNQPLTVIFKDGRAPVKMQNYMMTSKVLTDLDPRRYELIPLDQIDVAATQWTNNAAGVSFRIPSPARD